MYVYFVVCAYRCRDHLRRPHGPVLRPPLRVGADGGAAVGYLAICDPREQSIAELAEALLASRSAIAGAVKTLEPLGLVRRTRAAGERMDRVRIDLTSPRTLGLDPTEYQEQAALAREGLAVLADAPPERRAVLLEMAAFAELLASSCPVRAGMAGAARGAGRGRRTPRHAPFSEARSHDDRSGAAITARGMRKSFGEHAVLDGVDLEVGEGTIFALLGPNGAGKTTIVRILSTLIRADAGDRPGRRARPGGRPGRGARRDRRHRPVLGGRQPAHRRGEPAADGRPAPPRPRRRAAAGGRAARPVRAHRRGPQAAVDLLRRHAAPPRPGDDPRRRPPADLPR